MRDQLALAAGVSWVLAALLIACGDPAPAINDGRPASSCPTHMDLELIGSESRFDPGSSSSAHGVGPATGSHLTTELVTCDDQCRRCTFRGPVRGPADEVVSQRCLNDVTKVCAGDGDCPMAAGPCRFTFPPIPVPTTATIKTCSIVYFEPELDGSPPLQGVMDLLTGETDNVVMNLKVKSAIEACAVCNGDVRPNDRVADGRCSNNVNVACDVHGVGTAVPLLTSYDCPPSAGGLIIPLPAPGTTTTGRAWSLDASRPMCTADNALGKRCWCGVCSNDGKPCTANRDCGAGTCGGAVGSTSYKIANNGCMGTCNWNPVTKRGTCSDAPAKACFPDTSPFIASGTAEVKDGYYIVQLANLICMPSYGNGFIDAVGGFPGPLFFESRFRVVPRTVPQ